MVNKIYRNVILGPLQAKKIFTEQILNRLESLITQFEKGINFELMIVIDRGLSFWEIVCGRSINECANAIFVNQKVWDTPDNNGILIYLNLAEQSVEILSDRLFFDESQIFKIAADELVSNLKEEKAIEGFEAMLRVLQNGLAKYSLDSKQQNALLDRPKIV